MRALSFLFIALILGACTSTKKEISCQEADWYELGRREGAMGKPLSFEEDQLPLLCEDSDPAKQQILFDIGRKAGLVEYCKPQNAFEMGKDGKSYQEVCPAETETLFVEFFRKGQHVRELQEANVDIDSQLNVLFQQVQNIATDEKQRLETQISTLKKRKNQNSREAQSIEGTLNL